MIDDRDRRVAFLERELGHLREASTEALAAYRAIGMGKGGWNARDRAAFDELSIVLRRPVEEARDPGAAEDCAMAAARLLLACVRPSGVALTGPLWEGILIECDLAVPGLRQALRRGGVDPDDPLADGASPALRVAAAMICADERGGFPDGRLADLVAAAREAVEVPAVAAAEPGAGG